MNFDSFLNFLQQIVNFAGTFNFNLILFLFLICAIGEFSVAIPYLLETVWLMTGYHLGAGVFSFPQVVLLVVASQLGRNVGATALYYVSRLGSMPLMKLYRRHFESAVSKQLSDNSSLPVRFIRKINYLSPFSVALGRLFWLRIPLTMILAVQRKLKVLSIAVVISSLVFDSVYITVGLIFGATSKPEPIQMILYSLIGLTALYAVTFAVRRLSKLFRRQSPKNAL